MARLDSYDDLTTLLGTLRLLGWDSGESLPENQTKNVPLSELVTLLSAYFASVNSSSSNMLINGGFDFAQRQTPGTLTTISNDTYSADRWRISRENADLQYNRNDATGESGLTSKNYGTFKKITNTGKLMVYQIIEGRNSVPLRGKTVIFQAKLKASASKTVRMAIIQLTSSGTMDTIPATFVSSWGANSTDPTLGTNLSIITAAQSKAVTTSWQNFSVSVDVPSNSNNIVVAIWSDSQFAANDTLSIAEAGLFVGNVTQLWIPRFYQQELTLCRRFYWKTFSIDTGPAQSAGGNSDPYIFLASVAGTGTERGGIVVLPVPMFAAPTVTFYNPSAANAQVRDTNAAADCSSTATSFVTAQNIYFTTVGASGTSVGNTLRVHITAESEL